MANSAASIMQAYCAENPSLAQTAIDRDAAARLHFGRHIYEMYSQSNAQVVAMRAEAAPPGAAATSTPIDNSRKVTCSICVRAVHDFARHNRETHIIDPATTIFCPYKGCPKAITRDGQITIDDHLAASHSDFRNILGRGGDLLERSVKACVLNRLTINSAQHVAAHRQGQVDEAEVRRAHLLQALSQANLEYLELAAATLPTALQRGEVEILTLKKSEAVAHAILARKTLKRWNELFTDAEAKLN